MLKINGVGQIELGVQGENGARQIEIDMGDWEEELSGGTVTVYHRRPGQEEAEEVESAEYEDGVLTWTPDSTDTEYAGKGDAEIQMAKGDVLKKSRNIKTIIRESLA